jgi:hypothetical protein
MIRRRWRRAVQVHLPGVGQLAALRELGGQLLVYLLVSTRDANMRATAAVGFFVEVPIMVRPAVQA